MDILYADGSEKKYRELPKETIKDLAVEEITSWISVMAEERAVLKTILSRVLLDPEDMRFRQEIFRDIKSNAELREGLYEAASMIRSMKEFAGAARATSDKDNSLYTILQELRSISLYSDTARLLAELLNKHEIHSRGLLRLKEEMDAIVGSEKFSELGEDIKKMMDDLSTVRSAIIGVNFTPDLDIENIAAVEFLPVPTRSKYSFANVAAGIGIMTKAGQGAQAIGMSHVNSVKYKDPVLVALMPMMEKHLKRHFSSVRKVIAQYRDMDVQGITEMYEGMIFYTCCARYAEKLEERGYRTCLPDIVKTENKKWEVKDFYNIRLAMLREKNVVENDFSFSDEERIFVLTGPNRGGKTILEQGLGLVSLMASAGLFVTAGSCSGIPFSNILTHFPIDENLTINYGRLGEEAKRVREIVSDTDEDTLVLFNETYSTTSSSDALYLSEDLLHILKDKGAAVIFNTHIHELAKDIPEMNAWEGKGKIISVIMEIKDNVNTFKVKRAEPDYCSYARNIALKYGVTYEQMKEE
jgi:Mismatch repair ATPase (MutS family)